MRHNQSVAVWAAMWAARPGVAVLACRKDAGRSVVDAGASVGVLQCSVQKISKRQPVLQSASQRVRFNGGLVLRGGACACICSPTQPVAHWRVFGA